MLRRLVGASMLVAVVGQLVNQVLAVLLASVDGSVVRDLDSRYPGVSALCLFAFAIQVLAVIQGYRLLSDRPHSSKVCWWTWGTLLLTYAAPVLSMEWADLQVFMSMGAFHPFVSWSFNTALFVLLPIAGVISCVEPPEAKTEC